MKALLVAFILMATVRPEHLIPVLQTVALAVALLALIGVSLNGAKGIGQVVLALAHRHPERRSGHV